MFIFRHRTLISISGFVWLVIGLFLLSLGLYFVLSTPHHTPSPYFSLLHLFKHSEQTPFLLISCALLVGYLKGKYVLGKSVKRQVKRIASLPNPSSLKNIYSPVYYLLLMSMIGLGITMRYLPIALDTRGAIDIAIGAALINGASIYFRYATTLYQQIAKLK